MNRYALLIPLAITFVAGCGTSAEGESCKDTADCDDGLTCVFADGATADEDGTCEADAGDDDDTDAA